MKANVVTRKSAFGYTVACGLLLFLYVLSLPAVAWFCEGISFGSVESYSWDGSALSKAKTSNEIYLIEPSDRLTRFSKAMTGRTSKSHSFSDIRKNCAIVMYKPVVWIIHAVPGGWMINVLYQGIYGVQIAKVDLVYLF